MSFDSLSSSAAGCFPRRALTISAPDEAHVQAVSVFLHHFNPHPDNRLLIQLHRRATTEELIERVLARKEDLEGETGDYEIFEIMGTLDGQTFKERRLDRGEYPLAVQSLWNRMPTSDEQAVPKNRFVIRHKDARPSEGGVRFGSAEASSTIDSFLGKFLSQPQDREYADLCMLPELTEQTLLENLRDRFNSGHIYTYIGPILVAVNPFSFFPIYNPKYARLYCQSRRLGALPPHIFAIADITYHNMLRIKQNQCVVISGESGSGKTESTNFLLHHLTTLSQKGGAAGSSVEQTLLGAGPVLEAFGNAVTVQNNNSSRFGKFIRVNYRENGMVSGANVEIYLLEKSRIIQQAVGERNYHVFYYLLEGASDEDRKRHFLLNPNDYYYLNQNEYQAPEGVNEKYEYDRLRQSMKSVGFAADIQDRIFGIISAVLLLGNINFIKRSGYHSDDNAYIENEEVVGIVAELLDIRADHLLQALTMRRTVTKNDTVISRYSVSEAVNTRDAMAKCLYNALFHWIVLRMNQALLKRETGAHSKGYYIGILDIFGFEDVGAQWNSFEQLCINYANEHLQAYFNQHIFQFEQEEYLKEGISWTNIEYTDNTECVQLFQSKPYGILRLIDEESNIHNGTDQSMLDKLNKFLKNNEYYEIPQKREPAFIVAHYAGKVKYQVTGFREKNKDPMRHDVLIALKNSKRQLVRELLGNDPVAAYRWNIVRATLRAMFAFKQAARNLQRSAVVIVTPASPVVRPVVYARQVSAGHLCVETSRPAHLRRGSDSHLSAFLRGDLRMPIPDFCDTSMFSTIVNQAKRSPMKRSEEQLGTLKSLQILKEMAGTKRRGVANKPNSVSKQFEYSLSRLMGTLAHSTPYFIRCIKSNNEKIANHFDDNIILRQLRYTGMLETVRIRRAGYSVRIEYESFLNQYRILLPNGKDTTVEQVKEFIKNHPLIDTDSIQYGHTKMFMRDAEKLILDDHLHRTIMTHIDTLQSWFRTVLQRRKFLRMRDAAVRIQAWTRGQLARQKLRTQSYAALTIQTHWRRFREERKYELIRATVLAIQAAYRGDEARKRIGEIPRGRHFPKFQVAKVKKFHLPSFDLSNPDSLERFADSDDDYSDESTQDGLDDECSDGSVLIDDSDDLENRELDDNIDLDATFILEDARLKLIEENPDATYQRRQSLAATASTAKLKMLRRAASTESDQIIRKDESLKELNSPTVKKNLASKIGFIKAKKNLKALFGGRKEEGGLEDEEEDASTSRTAGLSPTPAQPPRTDLPHQFKMSRLHRQEPCALCTKTLTGILIQAHKCSRCKLSFHRECSSFAQSIPCHPASPVRSPTRRLKPWEIRPSKSARHSASPASPNPATATGSFNLTNAKQQTDPMDMIVECTDDLRQFSVFIFKKQSNLDRDQKRRDTIVDALFKKSLREFHMELIGYEAVLSQEEKTVLKYRDLISTFEGLLTKVCREEKVTFPTTLGVNAFRGFLNEFIKQQLKRKGSKQKTGIIKVHAGHRFRSDLVHVPTYCELCNQFMWHAEKIFICIGCRISCHKKCHSKVVQPCPMTGGSAAEGGRFFGASLNSLADDEQGIPYVLSKLFMAIELRALFVEGVYRKSGSLPQTRQWRRQIETAPNADLLDVSDCPIHVLTALVKAFFREMPEPLVTFDLYENFLNVSEVEEYSERVRCLSVMVELLPKSNKAVLDRLMYHLARAAHQEPVNKMGPSNLALIFAPCIMRRQDRVHAQEQLLDVNKQATCVQTLIEEKLRQYRATLSNIVELEQASEKVSENLRLIDAHQQRSAEQASQSDTVEGKKNDDGNASGDDAAVEAARQLFVEQLDFLDKQKERLIQELPPLAPVASSEDLSSSDEHSYNPCSDEYAIDFSSPPVFGCLYHPTKARALGPKNRRPPTKGKSPSFVVFF